jgi:FixJ family two-component response regulator
MARQVTALDTPARSRADDTISTNTPYASLRAGASAFLLKDAPEQQLVAAVRVVTGGGVLFSQSVTHRLIERHARRIACPSGLEELTPREQQALRLVRARLLERGDRRAARYQRAHREDARGEHPAKLDLQDRVQAVVLRYESGLVRPDDWEQSPLTDSNR